MKKSLIALAVLAASGAAMAQSSVTLFGVVDAAVQYTNGDGNGNVTKLVSGSESTSRIGLRGVEDLGGGLKAGFHLEGQINVDDGTAGTSSAFTGLNFQRRSTISLMGNFGEVRVGRDYVPTFNNLNAFSPFGTVGVGAVTNLNLSKSTFDVAKDYTTRANNSIGYILPGNLGGFYGQVMYAFGEQASKIDGKDNANKNSGNTIGLRVGYANGPLNVSGAYGETKLKDSNNFQIDPKSYGLGASYDFGVVKAFAQYTREELGSINSKGTRKNDFYMLGLTAPVGPGTIKATYGKVDQNDAAGNNDADQWAVGYVYDLSKRTAVYSTYARVNNKNGVLNSKGYAAYNNGQASTQLGGTTNGFEVGVRHSF